MKTFINLTHKLPLTVIKIYRTIGKNKHKRTRNIWPIKFNKICLNEEILLIYTRIKLFFVAIMKLTIAI